MTDHELCLAAAKAAGYTVEDRGTWINATFGGVSGRWHPLESDGVAFRLMVDCGIDIEFEKRTVVALLYGREGAADDAIEHIGTDKHAATRRAIVRAAASMEDV